MPTHKAKEIQKLLKIALLQDGKMEHALYEYELEEQVEDLKRSLKKDKDDYLFTITENRSYIAMVLIEKSGQVYINEQAREKLKTLWLTAYEKNLQSLIPAFAEQLANGQLPINGVKEKKRPFKGIVKP